MNTHRLLTWLLVICLLLPVLPVQAQETPTTPAEAQAYISVNSLGGAVWADAATTCTPASTYNRQPATNQLTVDICHLTPYALMGPQSVPQPTIYLPVVVR